MATRALLAVGLARAAPQARGAARAGARLRAASSALATTAPTNTHMHAHSPPAPSEEQHPIVVSVPREVRRVYRLPRALQRARCFVRAAPSELSLEALKGEVAQQAVVARHRILRHGFDLHDGDEVLADTVALHRAASRAADAGLAALHVRLLPRANPPFGPHHPHVALLKAELRARGAAEGERGSRQGVCEAEPQQQSCPDPGAGTASLWQMLSFYRFTAVARPKAVAAQLQLAWAALGVVGRAYVAEEGFNAQLAVPTPSLALFEDLMGGAWPVVSASPGLGHNGVDQAHLGVQRGEPDQAPVIVPPEAVGVRLNLDTVVSRADEQPFSRLQVLARPQVLADGLDQPLGWGRAGRELDPLDWHALVSRPDSLASPAEAFAKAGTSANGGPGARGGPVLLDCRNDYESEVGRFEGATPLNTRSFRETWQRLEETVGGLDRSTPILTFCTGGIRCAKVNAYLEEVMGFRVTARLKGGIVGYARTLQREGRLADSAFKGVNHVFDGRLGERITDDVLARCHTCGCPYDVQSDCANTRCAAPYERRLIVQCPDCAAAMLGACSPACRDEVAAGVRAAAQARSSDGTAAGAGAGGSDHASRGAGHGHGAPRDEGGGPPTNANARVEDYAAAASTPEPAVLAAVRRETEALFAGRAHMLSGPVQGALLQTLVAAAGCRNVLELGTFTGYSALYMARGLPADGRLVTCELDGEVAEVARAHFALDATHGPKIELRQGRADATLADLARSGAAFDLVFVDANKGQYGDYLAALLDGGLLRPNGLALFDNVLYRGLVVDQAPINVQSPRQLRSLKGARGLAAKLRAFNEALAADPRMEQVLLPLRDGLTIARRVK